MTTLDESSIIKIIQKNLGEKNFVSEDVETINIGKTKIIVKTDTLVESTDIPSKMGLEDAARKSIVSCVSDFAAKGVKPEFGIVSINLPKKISRLKVEQIGKGFKKACKEFGITMLGGDTNAGKELVFNVCLFGFSDEIVKRRGAKKGDLIYVSGSFGMTPIGLKSLLGKMKFRGKTVDKSRKSILRPKPKLEFGFKNKKYFTSSMDSSDGLSTSLVEMANQSSKKFVINKIPIMKDVKEFAISHNFDLNKLVFHGGEEYEFVFTVSPKDKKSITKNAKLSKTPIIEIGYVTSGKGVFVSSEDKLIKLENLGWDHFR